MLPMPNSDAGCQQQQKRRRRGSDGYRPQPRCNLTRDTLPLRGVGQQIPPVRRLVRHCHMTISSQSRAFHADDSAMRKGHAGSRWRAQSPGSRNGVANRAVASRPTG